MLWVRRSIILILLVVGLFFSSMNLLSKTFLFIAESRETFHSNLSLKLYRWANIMSPCKFMAANRTGIHFYRLAISKKNNEDLEKASQYFLKAHNIYSHDFINEFLLLKINFLLNEEPNLYFLGLKNLLIQFPNNLFLERQYVFFALLSWKNLKRQEKNDSFLYLKHLLKECFSENCHLIIEFYRLTNQLDLIVQCLPMKDSIYEDVRSLFESTDILIDYYELRKKIAKKMLQNAPSLFQIMAAKDKEDFENLERNWFSNFGVANDSLDKKTLIGCYNKNRSIFIDGSLKKNGILIGIIALKKSSGVLTVKAKSSFSNGVPAYMMISVNGIVKSGVYVFSNEFKEYQFTFTSLDTRNMTVGISFENDYFNKVTGGDRNLYIESVRMSS